MENNKTAIEIWEEAWEKEIHTTDYALKRIETAKSAKLTPIKIDTQDFFGYFQGSHGRYETFLDHCPCGDFRRSKLPCKHIYRLAIELGLMDADVIHNTNAIITPENERISLDKTIDIIENLSVDAQHELLGIAQNIRSTNPVYMICLNTNVTELINSGIIVNADPEKYKINFGKKNEIIELLDSEGITYDKKAKKSILEELCTQQIPEKAEKRFGKLIYVSIPTKFRPQKIHYYLHRKYDSELYYDEDMNFEEVPLLSTNLPDDDVTNQLINRGYYSRT